MPSLRLLLAAVLLFPTSLALAQTGSAPAAAATAPAKPAKKKQADEKATAAEDTAKPADTARPSDQAANRPRRSLRRGEASPGGPGAQGEAAPAPEAAAAQAQTPPEAPAAEPAKTQPAPSTQAVAGGGEAIQVSNSSDVEAARAPYNPFIDTRLTFVFADDNVLAKPGETQEPSPGPQFHATGANKLFFENYNTKDTGFETLTHLALYKHTKSFFPGLDAEAALVLRLQVNPLTGGVDLGDSSSYVTLNYHPQGWQDGEKISFTGFPLTSDRFRLGYSYRITYGGSDFFLHSIQTVPGMRVQVIRKRWYAWVGAKSTVLNENVVNQSELATEQVSNWGALAGAGVDVTPNLRVEANGGYFTRGTLQTQDVSLLGTKTTAGGGTVQVAWHVGRPVGTSIDLQLYKNVPGEYQSFFRPVEYGGGINYVIKSEFTYLVQTLANPEKAGSTVIQPAKAADINFAMQFDKNRVFLDAVYQDLSFILFNVPSFVPYEAYTSSMKPAPEMFAAVGFDHFLENLHLTPGLRVGVKRPAYVVTERLPAGVNPPISLTGQRTVVVRDQYSRDPLPPGKSVQPIIAVQGTARWDLAQTMAVIAELSYQYDPNRTTFVRTQAGETVQIFEKPNIFGFNIVLQARF